MTYMGFDYLNVTTNKIPRTISNQNKKTGQIAPVLFCRNPEVRN